VAPAEPLAVRPAATRGDQRRFRALPARLYAGDPAFIPALDLTVATLLDRKKNPFWKTARGSEWIAWRGANPVGRIGACRDEALFEATGGLGAVGFFDVADDAEAAAALQDAARSWLRGQGCSGARGPLNYTIHDTAGLLVDGFDTPPAVDTTWNPPWLVPLWETGGWTPARDMLAAGGDLEAGGPERARRFGRRAAERTGVTVRPLDFKDWDRDVERAWRVYNLAWADNWGHVAIPLPDFRYKAKDFKPILDPDLVRLAEHDGEPVGLMLGLPDLNVVVRRTGGRMLPFGWWHLLRARKTVDRSRVVILGVVPGFRQRGIEALMLSDAFAAEYDRYRWCEASWVLADNAAMLNGLALYNLFPYKRWRMYERRWA